MVPGVQRGRDLQGTNLLRPDVAVASAPPRHAIRQGTESLPAGTDGLRVRAEGSAAVTLSIGATVVSRVAAGAPAGEVTCDFPRIRADAPAAQLCFANA